MSPGFMTEQLFQSPEGDSLFFYTEPTTITAANANLLAGFQSPEGDSLFFYVS